MKFIIIITLSIIMVSCDKDSNTVTNSNNNSPPYPASNPTPVNGDTVQTRGSLVTLGWTSYDPDGDPIVYDVYCSPVRTSNPRLVYQDKTNPSVSVSGVGERHHVNWSWRITAKDGESETIGPLWMFTT